MKRRERRAPSLVQQHWHRFLLAFLLLAMLMAASVSQAHDPGLSVATASRSGGTVSIHLAMARTDVERLVTLDANHDGHITESEFKNALSGLQSLARAAFHVSADGHELTPANPTIKLDSRDGLQFDIPFQGAAIGTINIRAAFLNRLPRGHRQFISMRDANQSLLGEQMLDATSPTISVQLPEITQPFHGPERGLQSAASSGLVHVPNAPQSAVEAPRELHPFREFIGLGVEHIATGYDHLLFLVGLLIVGGSLKSALKIITSFTLAHSITLALATLNIINLSPRIIEPLIAASIVFVGIQNLLGRGMDSRWLLTFGFGLIHGCGFASALRDLGIGSNGSSIAVPLLSFNLGVELGQLAIAALVLPCIRLCRTSPVFVRRFVPAASALVVLAGGYWLIQRTLL